MITPHPPNHSAVMGDGLLSSLIFRVIYLVYQIGWYCLCPFVVLRLWWRSRKEPGYLKHIPERFGFYRQQINTPIVWIHAVSVGETRAAQPFIDALINHHQTILLTHMTPTGRQTGAQIFKAHIDSNKLIQAYLPYDFYGPVNRFYKAFNFKFGAMMETEAWPTLVFSARKLKIPLYLVNGRLSQRSASRVAFFGRLGKKLFQTFTAILAQTVSDETRYRSLGVDDVVVTGNLKFDVPINQAHVAQGEQWRKNLLNHRPTICLASSREGEEAYVLNAWKKVLQSIKSPSINPLLLIVPRHPARFDDVAKMIGEASFSMIRRVDLEGSSPVQTDVILGDSMGEMIAYLNASDVVVMGGSLLPFGGQNLIEPCSLGKPVILGQHTYNFLEASQDALNAGAAWRLEGESMEELQEQLSSKLIELLAHPEQIKKAAHAAVDFANRYAGATSKTIEIVKKHF